MAEPRRPDGPLSWLGLSVIVLTLAADQLTKAIVEAQLPFGRTIDLIPFLALHRVHNTGISFSFLSGFGSWGLIAATAIITVVVLVFWWQAHEGGRLATTGYALIIGGALGNLIDRIRLGYVIDFLLLHTGSWTLFVFNLADAALTLGPVLLILAYVRPSRRTA